MPIEVTPYSSVHMMWLLPQYFIITAGEVMFSVTGLQFSFTQVVPIVVGANLRCN
jgi:solute carrier family 15 oligopeptide transporter 1